MDIDDQWYTFTERIDSQGRRTVIFPDNLTPAQIERIKSDSKRTCKPIYEYGIVLDGLVPDINYCTTPLILHDHA
jgi:hypothetical protein